MLHRDVLHATLPVALVSGAPWRDLRCKITAEPLLHLSRAVMGDSAHAEALVAQEPALLGADVGALLSEVRAVVCGGRGSLMGGLALHRVCVCAPQAIKWSIGPLAM